MLYNPLDDNTERMMILQIVDFMVCTGALAKFNYVFVEKTKENIEILKSMGCNDNEIKIMHTEDNLLDVFHILHGKGYSFSPSNGFYLSSNITT